jgi:hypothetical protein
MSKSEERYKAVVRIVVAVFIILVIIGIALLTQIS